MNVPTANFAPIVAEPRSGLDSPIGFGSGVVAGSSRDLNEIRALKAEMERLKQQVETGQGIEIEEEKGESYLGVHTHSKGYLINCAHCKQDAVKKSPRAKYCSAACRIRSWNGTHLLDPLKLK